MRVAQARPEDWLAFRSVRLAALQDSPRAFGSTYAAELEHDEAFWRDWIGSDADADDRIVLLAYDEGDRVAGVVSGRRRRDEPSVVVLISLWVAPDARRSGVGAALTEAVLDWAITVRARRVTLSVAEDNDAAAQMYLRLGFTHTGERRLLRSDPSRLTLEMEHDLRRTSRATMRTHSSRIPRPTR